MFFRYFPMIAFIISCHSSGVYAGDTHEFMLENGLKIIVREDHRAPVVASQVWYKTGASYEQAGKTGLAHVLEHMMFKGTLKHPDGQFSQIMADNGANENAFTSQDYTAYIQKIEAKRLAVSFELEADRMQNLQFKAEEFAKEQQVVMEERRLRTEDKPSALLYEVFNATAFQTSPYRSPVIGWMNDIEQLQVADAKQWYQQWYTPNNAILVVVGDVQPQAVFDLAKQYFADIKPFAIKPLPQAKEVTQQGIKRVVLKRPAKIPQLIMGYKVPNINPNSDKNAWQPYALEVMVWVLDGGDSARFSQKLVRGQELATGLSTGYSLYNRLESLLTFSGTPSKKANVVQLENAIREQIKQIQTDLVSADELQRVKAQLTADAVFEKDSVFSQAYTIGQFEAIGLSWQLYEDYLTHISAITPEQIRQVAQDYLIDDGLTVAVLEPQDL